MPKTPAGTSFLIRVPQINMPCTDVPMTPRSRHVPDLTLTQPLAAFGTWTQCSSTAPMPVDDVTPAIVVSGQGTRRAGAAPSRVREPSSTPVLRRAAGSRAGSAPSNDARTWLIPIVSSAALHKGSVRVVTS